MTAQKIKTFLKKHHIAIVCLLISIWAISLRAERFAGRILWNDELYQLQFMTGPFQPFWERRSYGDFTCFPGDYLLSFPFLKLSGLSNITQSFPTLTGMDKWMLAAPHIFATVLGFIFLYLALSRYCKTILGFGIAFLMVSLNNNLIFHAFEFRPYAVLPTLALMVLYFTDCLATDFKQWNGFQKWTVGVFLFAAILFHMYGILIVGFCLVLAAISHWKTLSKNDLNRIVKYLFVIFLFAIPWWIWYVSGKPNVVGARDTFEYIPNPLVNFIGFIKGILGNLLGNRKLYVFLLGFLGWFIIPKDVRRRQGYFLFLLIILPIEIIFVLNVLKHYIFLQRQFVWAMPLFAVLVGWAWDALYRQWSSKRLKV